MHTERAGLPSWGTTASYAWDMVSPGSERVAEQRRGDDVAVDDASPVTGFGRAAVTLGSLALCWTVVATVIPAVGPLVAVLALPAAVGALGLGLVAWSRHERLSWPGIAVGLGGTLLGASRAAELLGP